MFTGSNYHKRIVTRPLKVSGSLSITDRQELVPGFDQAALEAAVGVLVGAGGIGSEIGKGLVQKGIGRLTILDHDPIDATNLNRQFFFKKDLGKRKGPRLARNLAMLATRRTVLEGYGLSFQDALALHLDLNASFVVCGVDNNEARVAVSRHCLSQNIPAVFVAVDLLAEAGQVFVQEAGKACIGCALPGSLKPRTMPCRTPAVLDILKAVSGIALYAIDTLIMDRKRAWNFRKIHLAGFAPSLELRIPRRQGCKLCDGL